MVNKKGVELSMNLVVVSIILLLVLLVVIGVFVGKINFFGAKTADCVVQGGKCAVECGSADFGTENFQKQNPLVSCPDAGADKQLCCFPLTT